ncbi:hypothetical protein ACTQ3O_11755 [Mediterraneibacter faecis]|uniref:hypothetical protein n=1 Tax=Mediterraneibacter faecis TaxID=592978 RepID=UPI003F99C690
MNMDMDMLAAPKKIVDGLTEVFQGFAQMFEGVSEQLALLAASAAEDEDKLLPVVTTLPPDKPIPADVSAKGVTVPRPRKKPVKRQKAPDAEPVSDNELGETAPDPTEEDAQDDAAAAEETEDNSVPVDTADTPPWEDTSQKEEPPDKAPGADKPTEPPALQKPRVPILTKDDITSVIVAKIKQKRSNNEKIGQLLKAYGVDALSDLPAEKYEAFLTDISQL